MTVPSSTARVQYAGNGVTTAFSTAFYFLEASDLIVVLKPSGGSDTLQTLGVHYTLTIPTPGSGAAGTVTMLTAPGAGSTLTIQRNTPFIQDTSFRTQGSFSPPVHEDAMDKLEFQIQELDVRLGDVEAAGAPGSIVAGNGLTSTGISPMTLHVGAGAGVQVNADTVDVLYGAAGAIANVTRTAAAAGVANTAARADHKHDVAVGAPTQLDSGVAVTGSSGNFADASHKHEIKSGLGVAITDTVNTAGSGPGFALEGHSHAHGNRGGGTLHAEAVASSGGVGGSAGFQSALHRELAESLTETTLTTTDATVTTIATATPTNTKAETILATITAKDKATGNSASYGLVACVKRQGGVTTLTGAVGRRWSDIEDVVAWDATIDVSSPDVRVRVTGAAGTNIDWRCRLERIKSP